MRSRVAGRSLVVVVGVLLAGCGDGDGSGAASSAGVPVPSDPWCRSVLDSADAFDDLHGRLPSDREEIAALLVRLSAPMKDRAFHDTDPHDRPAMVRERCGELVARRWNVALEQEGLDADGARRLREAAAVDEHAMASDPPVERELKLVDGPPFAVAGSPVAGSADGLCTGRTHALEVRPERGGAAVAEGDATVDQFGRLEAFVELPIDTPPGRYVLSASADDDGSCPAERSTSPTFDVRSRNDVDVGREW